MSPKFEFDWLKVLGARLMELLNEVSLVIGLVAQVVGISSSSTGPPTQVVGTAVLSTRLVT